MARSPFWYSVGLLCSLGCASQAASTTPTAPAPPPVVEAPPKAPLNATVSEILGRMDPKANPCDDFFRYACGGWYDRTELPPDKPRWGTFAAISLRNTELLRDILAQASKDTAGDADRKRAGAFYAACMDESGINQKGSVPAEPLLTEIDKAPNLRGYMKLVGKLHRSVLDSGGALFNASVGPDDKDPDHYFVQVHQGGLGFFDRDYYLKDDARSKSLREVYQGHVEKMLALGGYKEAKAKEAARAILAFETELAELSLPRAETRDPDKMYNKLDRKGLIALNPTFPWKEYFEGTGAGETAVSINVTVPAFFKGMTKLAQRTPLNTLKSYLRWHLLKQQASNLSADFENEAFRFQAIVSGAKSLPPRWERCVNKATAAFPEIVGKLFVEQTFAGDSKEKALALIAHVERAFAQGLPSLAWMDDATRTRALEKLHTITNKIGYPDKWRDYSSVTTTPDDHLGNVLRANEFEADRQIKRIGQLVDRTEWFMSPSIVNAYYNPSANEIVFPAGILQPPFFHREQPWPVNFGAIGMVMGHEITHGFDDSGRKYDGTGRLTEWWAPSVAEKFEQRAQCVDDFYSAIEVQPGVRINGKLTLGENIADLGGIKEAFVAYRNAQAEMPAPLPGEWGDFSADQLFFLGYSQGWCSKATPEIERLLITLDPHSPPKERVNVPLAHLPAFWEAFQCAEGTPMHPKTACEVW